MVKNFPRSGSMCLREENNPETTFRLKEKNPRYYERQYKKDKAISPDQEALAREVESYILENLRASAIL